ncbi:MULTISPECIES: hypothetical protein [Klebsiella pneumoniae complex]|uniref:hypothetical protein n=1 Tax=Klebsiella pneumoniae complex TaxID=3390273 RepID=UPI0011F0882C|nr:hypothetical protein [Klebsiella variicola]HBT4786367.1 hypothetical protein [Klebsiella variicola subsp. variicola]KAA0474866.1 hypothetical protein F0331_01010 [Klebsiella variicola]HBQ5120435.1 hypothetical protein [Klebsiella variicola]HCI9591139.1 hypothetical protein [Klebsiella variicola]HEK5019252.1 hypothetical protein [Klebsiella variicola]
MNIDLSKSYTVAFDCMYMEGSNNYNGYVLSIEQYRTDGVGDVLSIEVKLSMVGNSQYSFKFIESSNVVNHRSSIGGEEVYGFVVDISDCGEDRLFQCSLLAPMDGVSLAMMIRMYDGLKKVYEDVVGY